MRKPCSTLQHHVHRTAAALLLSAACLLAPATAAFAADTPNGQLTRDDYTALGFTVNEKVPSDLTNEPLSKVKKSSLLTKSEIYMAANGAANNTYILRDYLANPRGKGDISTNLSSDFGAIAGAHGMWANLYNYDNSNIRDVTKYGGGVSSFLSSNDKNTILSTAPAGFSGLYATSVAFSWNAGDKAKDNWVAELHAYGEDYTTTIDGTSYNGAISISLYNFDEEGQRHSRAANLYPTVNENMIYEGKGFKYIKAGYLQEYDAVFEIEAADVDGDGADELFCYVGAYQDVDVVQNGETKTIRQAIVNMFKKNDQGNWETYEYYLDAGLASDYSTNYTGWSNEDNDKAWGQLQSCPVVTIAAGDLDQDFKEDVAITVSAPQNKSNVNSAACEVFTWNGSALVRVDLDGNGGRIGLDAADGKAMVSANCAFGTFAAYDKDGIKNGSTVTGLVIAGWESFDSRAHYGDDSGYSNNHPYTHAAYRYVYYDLEKGAYVISDYQSVPLEKNAKEIARRASVHNPEHKRYACTLAPFALAAANLKGIEWGSEPINEALLFGGDIYENFACTVAGARPGLNECTGHISMCTDDRYNASNSAHDKSIEHVWIGDVVSGVVSDAGITNANGVKTETYGESFLAVVGTHRNEDLRKDDDYYWMTVSHFTRVNGVNKTGEEEVICESLRRSNNTYGTFISLALPDVDNDGVSITFENQYKMYTNPEVYAVLQDAPYYEDLEDSFGYLVLGGTGFGQSSGSETAETNSLDISLGASLTASEGFIEKFEGSIAGGFGFGYEYAQSTEVSYSLAYDSHAGEGNKAVIYTLPLLCYVYNITDEATGKTEMLVAPVVLDAETSVVNLETYDEIAQAHGLTPIGETLMTNKTGVPESYKNILGSESTPGFDSFGLGKSRSDDAVTIDVNRRYTDNGTWLGVNNDTGASISSSIEVGQSTASAYELSAFVNVDASFGLAFLQNEVLAGFVADGGLGSVSETVSSEGTEFSGTIDNLPEVASGYGFQWRLGVNRATIVDKSASGPTNRSFWVIGYDVRNVSTPNAPAVTGFAATATSDTSVSFSWKDVLPADTPYSYGIGILRDNASGDIEASDWRVIPAHTTEYTWENLDPNSSYRFAIAVVEGDEHSARQVGVRSAIVEVKTMPLGMTFAVYGPDADVDLQEATDPASLVHDTSVIAQEGKDISLSVGAVVSLADGTKADQLSFKWYRKLRGETEWKVFKTWQGSNISTIEFKNLSADDDGAQYYCSVGYENVAIDTGIIRVDVEEADGSSQVVTGQHRLHPVLKRLVHLVGEKPTASFVLRAGYDAVIDAGGSSAGDDPAGSGSGAVGATGVSAGGSGSLAETGDSGVATAFGLAAAALAAFRVAWRLLRKRG